MGSDLVLHEYMSEKLEDGMMIVGFPGVGLISSIAANFIIRTMGLKRVAGAISNDFPPYTLVHEGVPSPPVRIFAGERNCDGGEKCEQIIAVAAEFVPRPDLVKPLADSILDWCTKSGIRTIITLEGFNWQSPEEPKIYGVGSTEGSRKTLEKYNVEEMKEGMVSGLSGVLLYEGDIRGMDVILSIRPCEGGPTGRQRFREAIGGRREDAARAQDNPDPLYKEAEEIEKQIRGAMQSVNQEPRKPTPEESVVYG